MTKLSDTQRVILSHAAQHEALLATPPAKLPAAARQAVLRSMIGKGLLEEIAGAARVRRPGLAAGRGRCVDCAAHHRLRACAAIGARVQRTHLPDDGGGPALRATDAQPRRKQPICPQRPRESHRRRFRFAPPLASGETPEGPQRPPVSQHGAIGRAAALRMAAATVLAAWDAPERDGLDDALAALREVLAATPRRARASRPPRDPAAPRQPRTGTKQEAVLALLRRDEGATIAADHGRHRLAAAHRPRLPRRPQAEGHHRRGAGARPPGRAEQAGREGLLLHLPHRHRRAGGGRLMRLGTQAPRLAVGLTRVSTAEQGQSGLGLEAQQASIRAFVAAQGWTLVAEYSDIASGKDDRRPGFQAALARCRQLDAVLVAARLDRITRRAHTLSQLLEDGVSIRAADMPGADDLMLRIYAAMAQKERELISERTRAALAAAKARGTVLGGDRGYRPADGPDAAAAARARQQAADQAAHRLAMGIERACGRTGMSHAALARELNARGLLTPSQRGRWTHTSVARLFARANFL